LLVGSYIANRRARNFLDVHTFNETQYQKGFQKIMVLQTETGATLIFPNRLWISQYVGNGFWENLGIRLMEIRRTYMGWSK